PHCARWRSRSAIEEAKRVGHRGCGQPPILPTSKWTEEALATYHSAATPAAENISPPPSPPPASSFAAGPALAFCRLSNPSQTSFQFPRVAALEYSVARCSKKFACS